MVWDGFNKRKFPRVNVNCDIVIHSEVQSAPISAVTENVGVGGVCVVLDQRLRRFEPCRVRLELRTKSPKISCAARVVWVVSTKSPKQRKSRFDTGIEFLDLDQESAARIQKFLDSIYPEPSSEG